MYEHTYLEILTSVTLLQISASKPDFKSPFKVESEADTGNIQNKWARKNTRNFIYGRKSIYLLMQKYLNIYRVHTLFLEENPSTLPNILNYKIQ